MSDKKLPHIFNLDRHSAGICQQRSSLPDPGIKFDEIADRIYLTVKLDAGLPFETPRKAT